METFVPIQFSGPEPKYRQIAAELERQIRKGEFCPGERLPAIRTLSQRLQVNTVTIVKAYDQLERIGLVRAKTGSGVYVRETEAAEINSWQALAAERKPDRSSDPPPDQVSIALGADSADKPPFQPAGRSSFRQECAEPETDYHVDPVGSSAENPGFPAEEARSRELDPDDDELFRDEEIRLMQQGGISLKEGAINFATSTPTSDLFPVKSFKLALDAVLDRDGGKAFEYDEIRGYAPLREQISALFLTRYGIMAPPDRIQAISGAQQGIDIAAKALLKPGDTVLVEDPSYGGALAVFRSRGARIIGIPIGRDGIDTEALNKAAARWKPKLIYVMPDFQNPTTVSYTTGRRKAVIAAALRYGCHVIEDDYLSDLSYSDETRRPKPIKAYDDPRNERVMYIKSFSKLLMPGLRVGFLCSPAAIARDILQAKHSTDIASSGLIQRAFDAYLRSGEWEGHMERIRSLYQLRHRLLTDAAARKLPGGFGGIKPKGGFNLWVPLPAGVSGIDLFRAAAARGVLCTPGSVFRTGAEGHDGFIRLSIAAVPERDIGAGMDILAQTLELLLKSERREYISPLM